MGQDRGNGTGGVGEVETWVYSLIKRTSTYIAV